MRLFPLSSRDALAAKRAGDDAALAASSLPALESALVDFLVHDQRRAFLLGMCERIAALPAVTGADGMAARLAALRARVTGTGATTAPLAVPTEPPLPAPLPGCDICTAVAVAAFGFFTRTQAELYGSPQARADLAARGGFCRPHAQQFEAVAAGREAATALARVLLHQAMELRRMAASAPPPARAADLVGLLLPGGALSGLRRCAARRGEGGRTTCGLGAAPGYHHRACPFGRLPAAYAASGRGHAECGGRRVAAAPAGRADGARGRGRGPLRAETERSAAGLAEQGGARCRKLRCAGAAGGTSCAV